MNKLMIYGATGYVGRMAAEYAKAQGWTLSLPGAATTKYVHSPQSWTFLIAYSRLMRRQQIPLKASACW